MQSPVVVVLVVVEIDVVVVGVASSLGRRSDQNSKPKTGWEERRTHDPIRESSSSAVSSQIVLTTSGEERIGRTGDFGVRVFGAVDR